MVLQKCCCCCISLTKGCVILAYIGLSLSTVAVVTGVVAIHNINQYILDNYAVPSDEAFLYYKTAGLIFLSIFAGINLLNLMTCVCLIVGALQNKRMFLVPYMILSSIWVIGYAALSSYLFTTTGNNDLSYALFTILVLIVNCYFLLVVLSLYKQLKLREVNYPQFLRDTSRQQQPNYDTTYVKIP